MAKNYKLYTNRVTRGDGEDWTPGEPIIEEVALNQIVHYLVMGYRFEVSRGGPWVYIDIYNKNKKPRRVAVIDMEER